MAIGIWILRHTKIHLAVVMFLVWSLTACTYKDRVVPITLPDASKNMVSVGEGLKISARAFNDPKMAEQSFGFDVRKAGLLPVQVTFQNDSTATVKVDPVQTLLLDRNNKAWPVLSLEKTYQRTMGYVDVGETLRGTGKPALLLGAAGAVVGLAVGIVTGENISEAMGKGAAVGAAAGTVVGGAGSYAKTGRKIREDLANKSLKNVDILPNQIAYGVLFFPGMPEEASGATELRLSVTMDDAPHVVKLNLTTQE
jgi:hypothetical protein